MEAIREETFLSRQEFENNFDFQFKEKNLLFTFHPTTLDEIDPVIQLKVVFGAIQKSSSQYGIILTKPNADTYGRALIPVLEAFSADYPGAKLYDNLWHKVI